MYYVRKLSNLPNLQKLQYMQCVSDMDADILKQEFGTTENTLSFWKCDSLDDVKNAVKAILLSTTAIKTSQFIIVEQSVAERYGFIMDDTENGVTGYSGFENLHINMTGLSYKKIGQLMLMLKEIATSKEEELIPKYQKDEVKALIKEVINDGLLNEKTTNKDLLKDIEKLKAS